MGNFARKKSLFVKVVYDRLTHIDDDGAEAGSAMMLIVLRKA